MVSSRLSSFYRTAAWLMIVVSFGSSAAAYTSESESVSGELPSEFKNRRVHYKKTTVGALNERIARMHSDNAKIKVDPAIDFAESTEVQGKHHSAHLRSRSQKKHHLQSVDGDLASTQAEKQLGKQTDLNGEDSVSNPGLFALGSGAEAINALSPPAKHTNIKKALAKREAQIAKLAAEGNLPVLPHGKHRADSAEFTKKKSPVSLHRGASGNSVISISAFVDIGAPKVIGTITGGPGPVELRKLYRRHFQP